MPASRTTSDSRRRLERIHALLIDCLAGRASISSRALRRLGLWDRAACAACEMRIGGMLDVALKAHGVAIPPSAQRILDGYRAQVAARNATQTAGMTPVYRALDDAGVPFLLLKGAALNATFYPSPDIRDMSDVDVLIQPDDLPAADAALRRAGCRAGAEPVRADFFPRFYYEREYYTAGPAPVRIDLHVRPFRPVLYAGTVPREAFWRDAVTAEVGGRQVRGPAPPEMFLHLCVHAAAHGCTQVRWLWEIVTYIDRHGATLDWDDLGRRAEAWGVRLAVYRTLRALARTFGATLPVRTTGGCTEANGSEGATTGLRRAGGGSPSVSALTARFRHRPTLKQWLAISQAPRDAAHPAAHVLTNLVCLPGWQNRLAYLAAVARPDASHMAGWYPWRHRGWLPAAYLARVLGVKGKRAAVNVGT